MRTKIVSAAALCVMCVMSAASVGWAQQRAQPVVTGQANAQPSAASLSTAQLKLKAATIKPKTFSQQWTAKQGWRLVRSGVVTPKDPERNGIRLASQNMAVVDTQAAPYGFYMFSRRAHLNKNTEYAQYLIDAKRGYRYTYMCSSTYIGSQGESQTSLRTKVLIPAYAGGVLIGPTTVNKVQGTNGQIETYHFGEYTHNRPDGQIALRVLSDHVGAEDAPHHLLFYGCYFFEEAPQTTFQNAGDKA